MAIPAWPRKASETLLNLSSTHDPCNFKFASHFDWSSKTLQPYLQPPEQNCDIHMTLSHNRVAHSQNDHFVCGKFLRCSNTDNIVRYRFRFHSQFHYHSNPWKFHRVHIRIPIKHLNKTLNKIHQNPITWTNDNSPSKKSILKALAAKR